MRTDNRDVTADHAVSADRYAAAQHGVWPNSRTTADFHRRADDDAGRENHVCLKFGAAVDCALRWPLRPFAVRIKEPRRNRKRMLRVRAGQQDHFQGGMYRRLAFRHKAIAGARLGEGVLCALAGEIRHMLRACGIEASNICDFSLPTRTGREVCARRRAQFLQRQLTAAMVEARIGHPDEARAAEPLPASKLYRPPGGIPPCIPFSIFAGTLTNCTFTVGSF